MPSRFGIQSGTTLKAARRPIVTVAATKRLSET